MIRSLRFLVLLTAVTLAAACGSARSYHAPAPDDALDCSISQIGRFGYAIVAGGQEDGYARGRRGGGLAVVEYINVTASGGELHVQVWKDGDWSDNPTDEMKEEAKTIIDECGSRDADAAIGQLDVGISALD